MDWHKNWYRLLLSEAITATDFCSPLTFPLFPPRGCYLWFLSEMSRQLLDGFWMEFVRGIFLSGWNAMTGFTKILTTTSINLKISLQMYKVICCTMMFSSWSSHDWFCSFSKLCKICVFEHFVAKSWTAQRRHISSQLEKKIGVHHALKHLLTIKTIWTIPGRRKVKIRAMLI